MTAFFGVRPPLSDNNWEDLSEYTLSNTQGSLSLDGNYQVDFTALEPQHTVYLNNDFGSGHFSGDFEIQFEMKIDSFQNDAGSGVIGLSQGSNIQNGMTNSILTNIYASGSTTLRIGLRLFNSGGYVGDQYDSLASSPAVQHYYYTFKRVGTTVTLSAYEESTRSTLAFESQYLNVSDNYSKLLVIAAMGSSGRTADLNGFIKNIEIIEA